MEDPKSWALSCCVVAISWRLRERAVAPSLGTRGTSRVPHCCSAQLQPPSLPSLPDNDAEVVAAIDAENAGSEAGAGGEGGSDVGNAPKGAGVGGPRRDGKQMDLLLEVESLEPKQLMSVRFTSCHHVIMSG